MIIVPFIAGNIPENDIEKIRVDRVEELKSIVHLTTKANENVLLTGDRGQGKSFLTILFHRHLAKHHPNILPVRIDLTGLYFHNDDEVFIRFFPALILDQLCKEVWVSLLGKDYSSLLNSYDNPQALNLFKSKSEKRILEIYSILRKEEQKFLYDYRLMIGGSLGLKGEINSAEQVEWRNRSLQNFELLELTKEIKNTILYEHSRTKIMLICDEANKLTEGEQYNILQNYLDFFGANQFNFLLVASNFDKLKSKAEQLGLFRVVELGGFADVKLVEELIKKSFETEEVVVNYEVYELIYTAFSGHVRYTMETFLRCLRACDETKKVLDRKIVQEVIIELKHQISDWEKLNKQKGRKK